ncbi:MAG: hypothetical protein Q8O56_12505 [Solirubrobacteraceae bacterium]|nr:hypothetical protein [Solirubrobacteraceae bacterium]
MSPRRIAVIALAGVLIAGGTTAAIAAVTKDDAKQAEQAILDDAAERLDVAPDKLREALAQARDAQLDQAVEDGDLTRKQADAIKAARERSGHVLGGPPGVPGKGGAPRPRGAPFGPGGPGPHGFGPRRELGADLAEALGTTPQKLREQLRSGTSVADIAKANGKTLAGVRSAIKAAAKTRADTAVADGDLTRRQADAILERLDKRLEKLDAVRALGPRGARRRGAKPPAGAIRPGALTPGQDPVELVQPRATHS